MGRYRLHLDKSSVHKVHENRAVNKNEHEYRRPFLHKLVRSLRNNVNGLVHFWNNVGYILNMQFKNWAKTTLYLEGLWITEELRYVEIVCERDEEEQYSEKAKYHPRNIGANLSESQHRLWRSVITAS